MEDPADRGQVQACVMRILRYPGLSAVLGLAVMSASVEAIEAELQGRGQTRSFGGDDLSKQTAARSLKVCNRS